MSAPEPRGSPGGLHVTDVPVPVWVYSVTANVFRWANEAGLAFWGAADLTELSARDLSDIRAVTRARLQAVADRLRREASITEIWTVYPGGVPRTVPCTLWGVDWAGERCLAVMALPDVPGNTDAELQVRDRILGVVARSAERLLSGGPLEREREALLAAIGEAAAVDRCYYFDITGKDRWIASQVCEWCAPGVPAQIDNPELQNLDLAQAGFQRWIDRLGAGKPVVAAGPEQLPAAERVVLDPQDIAAICVHPVQVDGRVRGLIGFDIVAEREAEFAGWTAHVVDALAMAAHMLGAAETMRATQADLTRALAEARAANAAKSMFLANMSHELRTPLNAIIGFAQAIEQEIFGAIQPPRYGAYVADIRRSGEHLLALVNDVLDLERAQSGQLELAEETVALATDVVEPARKLVTHQAAAREVTIAAAHDAGDVAVRGEARKLLQIVTNLLTNAVKFSRTGDTVRVTTAIDGQGGVRVEVADRGLGMNPSELAHALRPFAQVGRHRQRQQEGTGLGLPLARQLAAYHDGHLELHSRKGEGTRAVLSLPAARRCEEGLPAPRPGEPEARA